MAKLHERVERVAKVDAPVLLLGESGVGKEVIARRIHNLSSRAHRAFVKLNCAALPAELLESELFGYEAGAFTGANKAKPGLFELAHKGSILLDEIGELPPFLQAKLLHVLQDQRFSRLGGRSMVHVDVRILAATNINIEQALASKKLREDLYYRLSAFAFVVPPLRERREEIPLLLQYFVERLGIRLGQGPLDLPAKVLESCMNYSWPGNVRELENFVKRYVILGDECEIVTQLGKLNGNGHNGNHNSVGGPCVTEVSDLKLLVRTFKEEVEKQAIRLALDQYSGKRREAAKALNISTKALLQKQRRYGIGDSQL
jgi:transcriptional regulator with PAS, ATPase and Fis domain